MRYRLQRHDGTDCSATMVPITVLRMVPIQRYRQDGSKTCFFSRILSFYLSTLELYSEKIIVQYSLKKRVILISHIFRIGSTKSTFFLFYIFFPTRFFVLTIFQQ